MKQKLIGKVTEAFAGARFLIKFDHIAEDGLSGSREVNCYVAGKMRQNNIQVLLGDTVTVEVEPDWSNGRIIRRN